MINTFLEIKKYLEGNPESESEPFFDSESLIWVDWKDFDDEIVDYYINDSLPEADKFQWEMRSTDKERGEDIVLKKNDKEYVIPYQDDKMDRDTTLKSIDHFISDKYQIRWYKESLGSDTLAFVVLSNTKWQRLEAELGVEKVKFYFSPISEEKAMFELSFQEVESLLKLRENVIKSRL